MKMNAAAKVINRSLEECGFAKSTQIRYRYLYDELFVIYIENSKSIMSDGTPKEARSAKDTLYTAIENGLRMVAPFMPFLTEELWQRPPGRPADNTASITVANYPAYKASFHDPRSEESCELILGCSKGVRSLLADYAVNFKDKGVAYISPLNQSAHDLISVQLSTIQPLSGKTPVDINILNAGNVSPAGCAVSPVSADANVYLEVKDCIQDARKQAENFKEKLNETIIEQENIESITAELSKVHWQDKDVAEALEAAKRRKENVGTTLQALGETVAMFEKMAIYQDGQYWIGPSIYLEITGPPEDATFTTQLVVDGLSTGVLRCGC